ncbi:MAG: ABC-type transport system substrate-binding protein, partial [Cognaticolwellia sp.]
MLTATLYLHSALLLSCAPDGPSFGLPRTDKDPKTLVFNNATEPEYLDPSQATGHPDGRIIGELFDGLTEYDPVDLSPFPSHALSWEQHPDGRGYTFHLREDAVWSDGKPVTSADYLWSWEHVVNPVYLARYAQQLYLVERGQEYNGNRVMLLTQAQGPFPAGAHLLASSNNLVRLNDQVEVGGVDVRDGASLLVLEREETRVKLQVRPACPDFSDLSLLLECTGET